MEIQNQDSHFPTAKGNCGPTTNKEKENYPKIVYTKLLTRPVFSATGLFSPLRERLRETRSLAQ